MNADKLGNCSLSNEGTGNGSECGARSTVESNMEFKVPSGFKAFGHAFDSTCQRCGDQDV